MFFNLEKQYPQLLSIVKTGRFFYFSKLNLSKNGGEKSGMMIMKNNEKKGGRWYYYDHKRPS